MHLRFSLEPGEKWGTKNEMNEPPPPPRPSQHDDESSNRRCVRKMSASNKTALSTEEWRRHVTTEAVPAQPSFA